MSNVLIYFSTFYVLINNNRSVHGYKNLFGVIDYMILERDDIKLVPEFQTLILLD